MILNNKSASPIAEPIVQLQRRLDEFRSSRPHQTKLPETLWQAAVAYFYADILTLSVKATGIPSEWFAILVWPTWE